MEKKYQVFVSSTYEDLIEERQKVIEALLSKNCFPVGMEYFPAANDDQFTVIKKLIDRCDYYILIIGGRYGSTEPKSGKSYTQLEFEYAVSKNIPVASLYHAEPSKLLAERVELTDIGKQKLVEFKKIVQERLCDSWKEPYELAFKVNKSLDYLFENEPRVGWVKADEISSADANKEILALRAENEKLKQRIEIIGNSAPAGSEYLQQGDDKFSIRYYNNDWNHTSCSAKLTWNKIIYLLGPFMLNGSSEDVLKNALADYIEHVFTDGAIYKIDSEDFYTIIIQLVSLGIIVKSGKRLSSSKTTNACWELTPYGERLIMQAKALKK